MNSKVQHTLRITESLDTKIQEARASKLADGKTYPSMNEILIELIETSLNGNQAPTIPDSIPKNVSPAPEDTISKTFEFNLD